MSEERAGALPGIPAGSAAARGCPHGVEGGRCASQPDACRRERLRLEANKVAAVRMLHLFDNPVRARREYSKVARDLNAAINLHNALCKPYPVTPLPL